MLAAVPTGDYIESLPLMDSGVWAARTWSIIPYMCPPPKSKIIS